MRWKRSCTVKTSACSQDRNRWMHRQRELVSNSTSSGNRCKREPAGWHHPTYQKNCQGLFCGSPTHFSESTHKRRHGCLADFECPIQRPILHDSMQPVPCVHRRTYTLMFQVSCDTWVLLHIQRSTLYPIADGAAPPRCPSFPILFKLAPYRTNGYSGYSAKVHMCPRKQLASDTQSSFRCGVP